MSISVQSGAWYAGGLAFECARCGRCCSGPEQGYVWVSEEDIAAIARHMGVGADEIRRGCVRQVGGRLSLIERTDNRNCVFLEPLPEGGMGCRIYPVRPAQCGTWPFWDGNLRDSHHWGLAAIRCRGINHGRLFTRDEIETRRTASRQ